MNCIKCGKDITPNEQYGDFKRPNCPNCHDTMQALRQAEKNQIAKESTHFPTDLKGRPFKHVL